MCESVGVFQMAGSTLFEQINSLWNHSNYINTETKPESIYMTNRFLSLDKDGFLAASDCNRMYGLPEWAKLSFLKYSIPKKQPPRNTYPKKLTKDRTLNKEEKTALGRICQRFNVNEFHGRQIMSLLEQQGLKFKK